MNKLILNLLIVSLTISSFGQRQKDSLLNIWNSEKIADSTRADVLNEAIVKYYLNVKNDSAYILNKQLETHLKTKNLPNRLGDVLNNYGLIETSLGNEEKGITYFKKALASYKEYDNLNGQAVVLNNIGTRFKKNWDFDKAIKYYNESLEINTRVKDSNLLTTNLINIGNVYGSSFKYEKALPYYKKSLIIAKKTGDTRGIITTEINLGNLYLIMNSEEEGLKLILKCISQCNKYGYTDIQMNGYHILMAHFSQKNNFQKAIYYGKQCLQIATTLNNDSMKVNCYNLFYENYIEQKDYKKANDYLIKKIKLTDSYDKIKSRQQLQKIEISRIRAIDSLNKISDELKQNLEYQKEKNNLTLAWGGSLSAVSIIAFLVYRKTKRKQRQAEEERQKQIEEKEKILKDLELSTIDAMIRGQEKERQKLASDLHDSVGATLSAAKLQFEHLIKDEIDAKMREELIKKTSSLLEDAYVEIRSMAHLKNSGVIAKNGLLPAVAKLAESASGVNSLKFEVQSHGLEERIDNSLEISIFRIIQELVTNVIKHSNATKGIIHLTNHYETINIMVEDNGKGFNPNQVTKTKAGMGISSIDKRVEHLDGNMTIESEKDKGTTVIIDIPL